MRRSGGGVDRVTIRYFLRHLTTNDADVSATAPYTSSQLLVFEPAVVEISFLVTIFQDNLSEPPEAFLLILDAGSLGPQSRTHVTILDTSALVNPFLSYFVCLEPTINVLNISQSDNSSTTIKAGEVFNVAVQLVITNASSGNSNSGPGQLFVFAELVSQVYGNDFGVQKTPLTVLDNLNGVFSISGTVYDEGLYSVYAFYALSGGLRGEYFTSGAGANRPLVTRIDSSVNFAWEAGNIVKGAASFVTVRWTGCVQVLSAGRYYFAAPANDSVRLSVSGQVLIDHFDSRLAFKEGARSLQLSQGLHRLEMEYRTVTTSGFSFAKLLWGNAANNLTVVPSDNLLSLYRIGGSSISAFPVKVLSNLTAGNATECYGEGLFTGTSGIPGTLFWYDLHANRVSRLILF